jgi:LDH2 family malate/lactate/ureidoglycolate dehydrogenase
MHAALVIQASVLYDFYVQVLMRAGVPREDAQLAAEVRLESALRQPAGFDVFNIRRLQNTVRRLQSGGINPTPRLQVVQERPTFTLFDGDNGLGAVVGTRAMRHCLSKAQAQGLALVGVRNSTTLGMMAYYAMLALQHQAIGFAATNTELKIGLPAWGSLTPALGNNPFALAIPAGQGSAIVLDMSVIATRPQGTDAQDDTAGRGPIGSAFLPRPVIGAHKGYGLALILEILTGVLTGAGFGQDHAPERLDAPAARHNLGHLFAVLDPTLCMPLEEFTARIDRLSAEIKHGQRAPGVERLLLPGELEHERRVQRLAHGIPVQADTPAVLQAFCDTLGLHSPLDDVMESHGG